MSFVSVDDLKRGMIVNSDVFSKRGSLLLYKGFKIENPDLVSIVLKRNGIKELEIRYEAEKVEKIKESEVVSKRIVEEVVEFKEEFNEVVQNITEDIDNFVESKDISDIKDLDAGVSIAEKNDSSILNLFQLVEKIKNERTDKYSDILQVSLLSYSIGKWLKLSDEELRELSESAMLHGVFSITETNSDNIHEIKGKDSVSKKILTSALYANERSDGSGPLGLIADEIPLFSRIISIADVFYTITTTSSELTERLSVFDALKIMQSEYLPILDTEILYIFLHRVASKYIGSTVRLSDGTSGIIVFVPENEIAFPFIKTDNGEVINLQSEQYKNNRIIEIL